MTFSESEEAKYGERPLCDCGATMNLVECVPVPGLKETFDCTYGCARCGRSHHRRVSLPLKPKKA